MGVAHNCHILKAETGFWIPDPKGNRTSYEKQFRKSSLRNQERKNAEMPAILFVLTLQSPVPNSAI
jgi:hypothetical protein